MVSRLQSSSIALEVGEVAREDVAGAAAQRDGDLEVLELLAAAGHQHRDAAGLGDLERGDLADAGGGAGDHDVLALEGLAGRGVPGGGGVEVLLPVVPQHRGVRLDRRQREPRAGQRLLGVPGVERGGERDVARAPPRGIPARPTVWPSTAWTGDIRTAALAIVDGRSRRGTSPPTVGDVAVDRGGELRRPGGLAERVDQVDDRLRLRVDQVERLAVAVGEVREVVHRLGDVVDRHHVGVAEVDADQRHPRRQRVAQPLDHREEVVGAVDLVHGPGLGVADHDRGTVDPPRHRALLADDPLGLELRAVVRRGEALALVEHRLVEGAVVLAGRGDRGDLVEAAGLEARRPARGRCGCRRRSARRSCRRPRSCRRSRRGGRSASMSPRCWAIHSGSTPRFGLARSPTTGMTRSLPQRRVSSSSRASEPSRTRTKISPSRLSRSSWTRKRPMNPVAPVTK